MARLAQRLPVPAIPKLHHVAAVVDDVVDEGRLSDSALRLAHAAQGMLSQIGKASTLPLTPIATLCCGQPFTPSVGVQHLHRLRADGPNACWLHGDARLSQRAPP